MTEKDINIEGEETLDEAPVEETAKEAANEEVKSEEAEEAKEEKDPLEKAQEQIEELKTQLLYKVAEFDRTQCRIQSADTSLMVGGFIIIRELSIFDNHERLR